MTASQTRGYTMMFIVVILQSLSPVLITIIYRSTNTLSTQLLWFFSATVWSLLTLPILIKKKLFSQMKKEIKPLLIFTLCNTIGLLAFFYSIEVLGPSIVSFLDKSGVVFSIMFGILLFSERFNIKEAIGLLMTIIGVIFLTYTDDRIALLAGIIFIASKIPYAYGFAVIKKNKHIDPLLFVISRTWFNFIAVLLIVLAAGNFIMPDKSTYWIFLIIPPITAIFSQTLQYTAYKIVPMGRASVLKNLSPFMVVILAYIFLKEFLTVRELVSGIVIVVGISLMLITKKIPEEGVAEEV